MKSFSFLKMFLYVFVVLLLAERNVNAASIPLFALPEVQFSDLSVREELAVSSVANALTTGTPSLLLLIVYF